MAGVKGKIGSAATKLASHPPGKVGAAQAQDAAVGPANEAAAGAKAAQVANMDAAPPGAFDKAAFIAAVEAAIARLSPANLDEAKDFSSSGKSGRIKEAVTSQVSSKKEQATGPVEQATSAPPNAAGVKTKVAKPLKTPSKVRAPKSVGAAKAMPKKKPKAATDMSAPGKQVDSQMVSAGVTEEQLAKSNEPAFVDALGQKKEGEKHSKQAPGPVRAKEAGILGGARSAAGNLATGALAAMSATRTSSVQEVGTNQTAGKAKDEAKRREIAGKLESIYQATKSDVEGILSGLDTKVENLFTTGEAQAKASFDSFYEREMDRYYDARYSGLRGKARWVRDKFSSPPGLERIFKGARKHYVTKMRTVVSNIADVVSRELTKAKQRTSLGRTQISDHIKSLPTELQKVGGELADGIDGRFDQLESSIDDKQNELVNGLAQRYSDATAAVDAEIEKLRSENQGLWDRAKNAIGGVIETIRQLKDMFVGLLSRAAAHVSKVLKDPIGFLGNLVGAVKGGLQRFLAGIGGHLKKALMTWLLGALGPSGIELPTSLDLKGILKLVLSVLGLTWGNIRGRIVKGMGKNGAKIMGKIESGIGLISRLVTEGPIALISIVMEKIGDLKERVLGAITGFIKEKVIMGGIMWLMGLLNPAAAFVKAVKTIIDIVRFFVDKGKQIWDFVTTVVDSFGQIANGSLGGAAAAIERVLAKLLPVLIGFLASLLGLGGIGEKVKEIIGSIRKPINKIIDGVVKKAVRFGKKLLKSPLGRKLTGGVKKAKAWAKKKIDAAKAKGRAVVNKVKGKIYGGTPEEREAKGLASGIAAVNKYAGRPVGKAVLMPALAVIKARRGLSKLDVRPLGGFWHVEVAVQRNDPNTGAKSDDGSNDVPAGKPGHAQSAGKIIVGKAGAYSAIGGGKFQEDRDEFKGREELALIAEHVIPRTTVDWIAKRMGFEGAPRGGKWDEAAKTILIYKSAADRKTKNVDPNTKNETEAAGAVLSNPASSPQDRAEAHMALSNMLEDVKRLSVTGTDKEVEEEHKTNHTKRGSSSRIPGHGAIADVADSEFKAAKSLIAFGGHFDASREAPNQYSPEAQARALGVAMGRDPRINQSGQVTGFTTSSGRDGYRVKYFGTPRMVAEFKVQDGGAFVDWKLVRSIDSHLISFGVGGGGSMQAILSAIADQRGIEAARFTDAQRSWVAAQIQTRYDASGSYEAAASAILDSGAWDTRWGVDRPALTTMMEWERDRRR